VQGGYRSIDSEDSFFFNGLPTASPGTELASITNERAITLQNSNLLTYSKELGDHALEVTGLFEQQYEEFNGSTASSIGFLTNSVTFNNLALGASPQTPESARLTRSLLSYMGRINYRFKNRYLLTLTGSLWCK